MLYYPYVHVDVILISGMFATIATKTIELSIIYTTSQSINNIYFPVPEKSGG